MRTCTMFVCLTAIWAIAAPGDRHDLEMRWQEDGFNKSIRAEFNRFEPFAGEPDTQGRDVFRGVLPIGPENARQEAGFLWDKTSGKLYVDLNFDGDLTNDPKGQFTSQNGGSFQDFTDVRVAFAGECGIYKYNVRASLYESGNYRRADFYILSGYGGSCDLYGKQWQLQACDAFRGKVDDDDAFSIFSESSSNRLLHASIPERIFIDGRCFDITFAFKPSDDDSVSLWCTLTERRIPLGTLVVTGQWINQLVLGDGRRGYTGMSMEYDNSDMLILPELSDDPVGVPAGDFEVKQITLKFAEDKPAVVANINKDISIPEGGEAKLVIGGPLKSSVDVVRQGNALRFTYKLLGAGGEDYNAPNILGYDEKNKPTVAVYKGDTQLTSGTFEYG